MANPFKRFRKNRKTWLAFVGVVCMLSFVVLAPGTGVFLSPQGGARSEVAAETKAGSLSRNDLEVMLGLRKRLNDLMQSLTFQPSFFGPEDRSNVFDAWLKAKKAEALGIEVSDEAIKGFMRTETGVSLNELSRQLQERGMAEGQFFAGMRNELLARRLEEMFNFQDLHRYEVESRIYRFLRERNEQEWHRYFAKERPDPPQQPQEPQPPDWAVIPSELKEYWDQQHRRAYVEVLAVPVKEFAGAVEEPSEEDVKKFFDKYRTRIAHPALPEPGFKLEHLAQFQFFQIHSQPLAEAARAVVTPGQIRQRYEQELELAKKSLNHRLRFNREDWLRRLPPKKDPSKEKEKPTDSAASPKTDGSGASLQKPVTPADDAIAGNVAPREYPVAFQAEGPEKTTGGASGAAAPAAKTDSGEKKSKTAAGDAKPAVEKPAEKPPAAEAKPKRDRSLTDVLQELKVPRDIRDPDGRDPQFKPLWQVEEDLRNELAAEQAQADVERLLSYLKEPMDRHGTAWQKWDNLPRSKKTEENKPANPLDEPSKPKELIQNAWSRLVSEKKAAWTKALTEEKNAVEAKLKSLAEEAKLTAEQFRKRAEETKNEEAQQLLADQKRLADIDKAVAEMIDKWTSTLAKSGPLAAPSPGGTTQVVVSFETTAPRLTLEQFRERNYALAGARFTKMTDDTVAQVYKTPMFQPTSTNSSRGGGDQFVFWMIQERPEAVPVWQKSDDEYAEPHAILTEEERAAIRAKYKEYQARPKARKKAEQIAEQLRAKVKDVPIDKIQAYFKVDASGQAPVDLSQADRQYLKFETTGGAKYRVVVREGAATARAKVVGGALQAPPPGQGRIYADRAEAERQAKQIAELLPESRRNKDVLVIVGKTIGTVDQELAYRGVMAYFWSESAGKAKAADGKPQLALSRWPGMLADSDFQVGPTVEDKPSVTARGEQLEPFTMTGQGLGDTVKFPGEDFVRATFGLKRGEFAVAFNRPQTVAYLIHVADYDYLLSRIEYPDDFPTTPPRAKAGRGDIVEYPHDFTSPNTPPAISFAAASFPSLRHGAADDLRRLYHEWMDALYAEYDVKRNADIFASRESASGE